MRTFISIGQAIPHSFTYTLRYANLHALLGGIGDDVASCDPPPTLPHRQHYTKLRRVATSGTVFGPIDIDSVATQFL